MPWMQLEGDEGLAVAGAVGGEGADEVGDRLHAGPRGPAAWPRRAGRGAARSARRRVSRARACDARRARPQGRRGPECHRGTRGRSRARRSVPASSRRAAIGRAAVARPPTGRVVPPATMRGPGCRAGGAACAVLRRTVACPPSRRDPMSRASSRDAESPLEATGRAEADVRIARWRPSRRAQAARAGRCARRS